MFSSPTLNVNITKLFCKPRSIILLLPNGRHISKATSGHIGVFSGVTIKKGETLTFNYSTMSIYLLRQHSAKVYPYNSSALPSVYIPKSRPNSRTATASVAQSVRALG